MSQHSQPDDDHGVAHVMPAKTLLIIFALLMFFTVVTVAVTLVPFGPYALLVALVIAVIKAALVALYFMHLRYDNPFNSVVFVGCLIFVGLFLAFSLTDSTAYQPTVYKKQAAKIQQIDVNKLLEEAAKEQSPSTTNH